MPRMIHRTFRPAVACLAFCLLFALTPGALAQDADSSPSFEATLSDEDYQAGLEAFAPAIQAKLERPNHGPPAARGVLIERVADGSQAERIGITEGSMIVAVNGVEVYETDAYSYQLRDELVNTNRRLEWIDPQGERHAGTVGGGRIGLNGTDTHDCLAWYARSDERGEAWDDHMLLALHLLDRFGEADSAEDLVLAEDALARAQQAGYPNELLLHSLGAYLAVRRNQFPAAMDHLSQIPNCSPDRRYLMPPSTRIKVALAVHNVDYISEQIDAHEYYDDPVNTLAIQRWIQVARQQPQEPTPAQLAEQCDRIRLNGQLERDRVRLPRSHPWLIQEILAQRPVAFNIPAGSSASALMRHPDGLGDFEITLNARLAPNFPGNNMFPDTFYVGVFERDVLATGASFWDPNNQFFGIHFEFQQNRTPFYRAGTNPFPKGWNIEYPLFDITGETAHEFRLIRVGSRAQVFLDGSPVLDTYVDPNARDLSILVFMVGMHYQDLTMSVDELRPRNEVN